MNADLLHHTKYLSSYKDCLFSLLIACYTWTSHSLKIKVSGQTDLEISQSEDLIMCVLVALSCPTLFDPVERSRQTPPSMGFSRQEYWSGLPFPSPVDLPNPGIEPRYLELQADSLPIEVPNQMITIECVLLIDSKLELTYFK